MPRPIVELLWLTPDGTDDIEEPKVPEMDDDVLDAPGAETVASNPSSHPRLSEVKEDIVIGSAKTTSTTHHGASAAAGAASGDVSRGIVQLRPRHYNWYTDFRSASRHREAHSVLIQIDDKDCVKKELD